MAIPKFPELEEQILKDWNEQQIFKKTLEKPSPKGRFVFYDGPPTANGMPHIGHVETRAFKDIIPRFKTMQGYRVERKAGWDTQGLPVELEVEKQLGLSGKKDIEKYGIEQFNTKAKASVWKYKDLWEKMTARVGFWLDTDHPYITYEPEYIETLWWIFKQVWDKKLLVQDYKVVPYCPRCGTALSSHEVAQGYENVEEDSVYVKFELVDEPGTFILVWTTTPWTLPGNVALAVHPKLQYIKIHGYDSNTGKNEFWILEKNSWERIAIKWGILNEKRKPYLPHVPPAGETPYDTGKIVWEKSGAEFASLNKKYTPLFDFLDLRNVVAASHSERREESAPQQTRKKTQTPRSARGDFGDKAVSNAYTIVAADFVTTEDGTGVVHTAVMYGVDDFELGTKLDLPKVHTVDETGRFNELAKPWSGWKVKDTDKKVETKTTNAIIEYLRQENKLYKVEKIKHDYPFCWRCKHPLLYYAKTSWFIQMSKLRDQLIANNKQITWYPAHIKEGRFGEWLREVKDWAISRERYWGTPLPIWQCNGADCKHQECLGSYQELIAKLPTRNRFIFIRHGESDINARGVLNTVRERKDISPLTSLGQQQAQQAAAEVQKLSPDIVLISSPFRRARETAEIIGQAFRIQPQIDERANEFLIGPKYEDQPIQEYHRFFSHNDWPLRFTQWPEGGESWYDVRARVFDLLHELDRTHEGKTIVIVTHGDPIIVTRWATMLQPTSRVGEQAYPKNGELVDIRFSAALFRPDGSFDPHRPFIDAVSWPCPECGESADPSGRAKLGHLPAAQGGVMRRIPEVADAWFDSGAMPFAQWHYPFENKAMVDQGEAYPADYISEAIDQTRGWFYTLLAIGTLLVKDQPPYKNVVVLGHINDAKGKKLSKSLGNYVDPMELIAKYGADALRWFLFTTNQPWDPKNFDPKFVDEGIRKTFLILMNVVSFWELYRDVPPADARQATHPLDRWILSAGHALTKDVTERLAAYDITGAARAIAGFVTELSTWYVRRSRDRFKGEQASLARAALTETLLTVARLLAPFTPFLAEHVYHRVGGAVESVHLESWPMVGKIDNRLLNDMSTARRVVEQGHALRAQAGMKVRQPLSQVTTLEQLRPDLDGIVRDELNVKELHWTEQLPTGTDWLATDRVALDITITDELKEEGMLRDLVREVNALRKTASLVPSDQIILHVAAGTTVAALVERYSQELLGDVRARAATPSLDGATHTSEIELDGQTQTIGLTKV